MHLQGGMDGVEAIVTGNRLGGDLDLQLLLQRGTQDIVDGPDDGGLAQGFDQPQGFDLPRGQGKPDRRQACGQGIARQSEKRPPIELHENQPLGGTCGPPSPLASGPSEAF